MAFTSETVKVFLEVLDSGSFSAAARTLKRVPSAISMSISQLEAELDIQLFDRSAREAIPTTAARALEPNARQVQRQLRELATLASEFPTLELEIRSEPQADALRLLHEGSVQIALVFERPAIDERERFEEFGSELLVAVVGPGYPAMTADGRPIREEQLMNMRQIVVASGDVTESDPRMVRSRQIWLTDRTLIQPLIASGSLVEIEFENMTNELWLWVDMVWVKHRPLGLGAKRYIELMREAL